MVFAKQSNYLFKKWCQSSKIGQFNEVLEFAKRGLMLKSDDQDKIELLDYVITVLQNDLKYSLLSEVIYKKQVVDLEHRLIPSFVDEFDNVINLHNRCSKFVVDISLVEDCVISVPWDKWRIWDKTSWMLKDPFIRDSNHQGIYFPELKLCFVLSGHHSIAVGTIYKKGVIKATECSIEPAFQHLKSDGANWINIHNNKILEEVKDFRIAALFELAKMKYNMESSRKGIEMKKITIDAIRDSVITYGIEYDLAKIVLFGSYARHDETENSDIDLMIDADNSNLTLFDLAGMREDLKQKLGKRVDIVTAASLDQKVKENVMEDQIILYEREK